MDNNQEELQLWREYNNYLEGIVKENAGEFLNFALWKQQQNKAENSSTPLQITMVQSELAEGLEKCLQPVSVPD